MHPQAMAWPHPPRGVSEVNLVFLYHPASIRATAARPHLKLQCATQRARNLYFGDLNVFCRSLRAGRLDALARFKSLQKNELLQGTSETQNSQQNASFCQRCKSWTFATPRTEGRSATREFLTNEQRLI